MAAQPGQIFSFYSFKGGVGRSMALANVAALLGRAGNSVLVVDWDLEAPGLQKYFNRFDPRIDDEVQRKPGVVDLLTDLQQGETPDWQDAVINVSLKGRSGPVKIDFISAGRVTKNYSARLQKLQWQRLYSRRNLGGFLENLRNDWKQTYEYVFLDSRTGVTDIGDVCTVLLPDVLVALFVTNEQNLDGVQSVIDRSHEVTQKLPMDRGRLITLPILARDEVYNEYGRAQEWRLKSAAKFAPVLTDWLPKAVSPTSYFQKMFIPYVTHWSFGETLPVIENEDEIENPASISAAYSRLATLIRGGLDWSVIASGENPLEIDTLKADKAKLERSIGGEKRLARLAIGLALAFALATSVFAGYKIWRADAELKLATEGAAAEAQRRAEDDLARQRAEMDRQQRDAEAALRTRAEQIEKNAAESTAKLVAAVAEQRAIADEAKKRAERQSEDLQKALEVAQKEVASATQALRDRERALRDQQEMNQKQLRDLLEAIRTNNSTKRK